MKRSFNDQLNGNELNPNFILDNIGELIIIYNKNQKFLFASPSYCQLFCKEKEELIGLEYTPTIHHDDITDSKKAELNINQPP